MNDRPDLQDIRRRALEHRGRQHVERVLQIAREHQKEQARQTYRERHAPQVMNTRQALIGFAALGWFLWWAFTTSQTNPAAQLWAGIKWLLAL